MGLSWFLLSCPPEGRCSCTLDKSVMIIPRPRQSPLTTSYTWTNSPPLSDLVPRHSQSSIKIVPGLQKHAPPTFGTGQAYLSCHQDHFSAKAPGLVAGWLCQVTLTCPYPLAAVVNASVRSNNKKFASK